MRACLRKASCRIGSFTQFTRMSRRPGARQQASPFYVSLNHSVVITCKLSGAVKHRWTGPVWNRLPVRADKVGKHGKARLTSAAQKTIWKANRLLPGPANCLHWALGSGSWCFLLAYIVSSRPKVVQGGTRKTHGDSYCWFQTDPQARVGHESLWWAWLGGTLGHGLS